MKPLLLGSAASMLMASLAFAQPPAAASHPAPPGVMPAPSANTVTVQPLAASGSAVTTIPRTESGKAAAGDKSQAVATSGGNASQPAKGANSFAEAEARRRLEGAGLWAQRASPQSSVALRRSAQPGGARQK